MCLAVPGQLLEVTGDQALASLHGNKLRVSTALIPGAAVGDWVLIHAGFAIQKLEGTDVEEAFAILHDIAVAEAATIRQTDNATVDQAAAFKPSRPTRQEVSR